MRRISTILLVLAITGFMSATFAKMRRSHSHSSKTKSHVCVMPNGDTPPASSEAECQKAGGKWTKGSQK